jgi:cytochrome c-type biogenesis protein CcmH/NrfG
MVLVPFNTFVFLHAIRYTLPEPDTMNGGESTMVKAVFVCLCMVVMLAACQQKEEPKTPYQAPPVQMPGQPDTTALQEIVRKEPGNVKAWIQLGNLLMDTGRFPEAIEAYQQALALDPNNVDVRVDMGTCYRSIGKSDVAIKEYRKAIEINPNHPMARKNAGVVLAFDLKNNAEAVKEFEKYLQLAPSAPDAPAVRQEVERLRAAR